MDEIISHLNQQTEILETMQQQLDILLAAQTLLYNYLVILVAITGTLAGFMLVSALFGICYLLLTKEK